MADTKQTINKEVKAFARHVHVSPRKLRLVADLVRQQNVEDALEQLRFSSKNAALPITKLLNSAIANAVHNFNLNKDNLFIKTLTVDGGPVFKSYAPRAQGRAFVERKRTSHINIILESRTAAKKKTRSIFSIRPKSSEHARKTNQQETGKVEPKSEAPKAPGKPDEKIKQNKISLKRRLFNRK